MTPPLDTAPQKTSNFTTPDLGVRQLRLHSRHLIRALGLLDDYCLDIALTPAQAHALIELEAGPINGATLADRLCLNKSNASRTLKQLHTAEWVTFTNDPQDQRSQLATLTAQGRAKLQALHEIYDSFAGAALAQLTPTETETLLNALATYKRALDRAAAQAAFSIREITPQDDPLIAEIIQRVSAEHGLGGAGYGVSDPNLTQLSAHYQQPKHIYWVVTQQVDGLAGRDAPQVMGGAGVQTLIGEPTLGELSKMYLLPAARGCGLARRLACQAISYAQQAGYQGLYLETTASLAAALALYESLGFKHLTKHRGNTGHQSGCEIAMLYEF